ncbi:hypothetical protein [uncultured Microscilla sp.]|uniref:hypothetical protein n=1 Tax=uncultured Microscilla sp. TaxID=432653 RepID=UPI0026372214|nr:hypothetical protein [uncultured Microscilla sp.]
MPTKSTAKDNSLEQLNKLLRQNKKVDFKTFNLLSAKELESLNWSKISKKDRPKVLKQAKAYQRLLRLLGEHHPKIAKELLKQNLHSAVQIASIPQKKFMNDFLSVFKDEDLMKKFYARALATRSKVLLKYMNIVQNRQPHAKSVNVIA